MEFLFFIAAALLAVGLFIAALMFLALRKIESGLATIHDLYSKK